MIIALMYKYLKPCYFDNDRKIIKINEIDNLPTKNAF